MRLEHPRFQLFFRNSAGRAFLRSFIFHADLPGSQYTKICRNLIETHQGLRRAIVNYQRDFALITSVPIPVPIPRPHSSKELITRPGALRYPTVEVFFAMREGCFLFRYLLLYQLGT